ncbi:MAG TPA: preprotein translocase subunit SecE [Gemmatimonadaceae bacterium]|jgi:preprotein translocase subunit SecE|nr:preprotein translocase subunit SecE [Gemmatimonadaceae bacterium]
MAAVDVTPAGNGKEPGLVQGIVAYCQGSLAELRKVTWPDWPQVRQATIAIMFFVLAIGLLITLMDVSLNGLLVRLIPSLFGGA